MSFDIYFTIRENKKTYHEIDTLFFGKQEVFDFKSIGHTSLIFDSYEESLKYIYNNNIINCHIRRTLSTGGGISHRDYYTSFNVIYKGKDYRKENDYPYGYKRRK